MLVSYALVGSITLSCTESGVSSRVLEYLAKLASFAAACLALRQPYIVRLLQYGMCTLFIVCTKPRLNKPNDVLLQDDDVVAKQRVC